MDQLVHIGRSGLAKEEPLDFRQLEAARLLSEECCELGVESSKLERCGQQFRRTDIEQSPTVRDRFSREVVDVLLLIDEALDSGIVDRGVADAHIEEKLGKLRVWSHTCGMLSSYPLARTLVGSEDTCAYTGRFRTDVAINIDLDGTLFDFDGSFFKKFGVQPTSLSKEHKWGKIDGDPNFFAELEVIPGAVEFMRLIAPLGPRILTGCPRTSYQRAATQKIKATRAAFGDIEILPIQGSRNKYLFLQRPGDVLLDDRPDVCELWTKAGGFAVLFKGSYQDAYSKIIGHLRSLNPGSDVGLMTIAETKAILAHIRHECEWAINHRRMTEYWRPQFVKMRNYADKMLSAISMGEQIS